MCLSRPRAEWYSIVYQWSQEVERKVQTGGTYSERGPQELFPLIEQVNEDRTPIEIISKRGNAVLMSADDYSAWVETAYLFRSPANASDPSTPQNQPNEVTSSNEHSTAASEPALHAPSVGGLSILAGNRPRDPEAHQQTPRRSPTRSPRRHWETRTTEVRSRGRMVTAHHRRTPTRVRRNRDRNRRVASPLPLHKVGRVGLRCATDS